MAEALRAAGFPLLASKLSGERPRRTTARPQPAHDARIIFAAYFEGTANIVERRTTQIGLFHELIEASMLVATSAAQAAERRTDGAGPRSRWVLMDAATSTGWPVWSSPLDCEASANV